MLYLILCSLYGAHMLKCIINMHGVAQDKYNITKLCDSISTVAVGKRKLQVLMSMWLGKVRVMVLI